MNKQITVSAVSAAAAITLAAGGWLGWTRYQDAHTTSDVVYAYDTSSPTIVAQHATAVFTGTVLEDTGPRTVEGLSSDTYRVRVDQVLKGVASGEVVITQSTDGEVDRYRVGRTYMWATNPNHRVEDGVAQLYDAAPRPANDAAVTTWTEAVARAG
ncbi:hypothetical protein Slala03_80590 [Streptomyces lavendulae subsp. lavendulae]|uniref:hypothetical protein n=1 Tax=Streptomyces lavendulae TaxID=1914 RepID=UPI0024A0B3BE|nr:hypothetical protein [Streptomyces lavendulae]GLV88370.1 hypothetical protein Slala03_80590 [Streptomyces lavendulae subsp. lavendulae]